MKSVKKAATYFLNFGSQIKMPPANCKMPKDFQMVGGMLFINEHGGSKKFKNLSRPIIKKRIVAMTNNIFFTIILQI